MATFETLAAKCAASVALDLLVAIASVESGVHPLAVREGAVLTRAGSAGEGVALAVGAADQGREARIGLMGLTERQLRAAGLTVTDGFDPCASMTAAAGMIAKARASLQGQTAEAGDRDAIRMWWPDARFGSLAALEAAIARERASSAALVKREVPGAAPPPPASLDTASAKPSNLRAAQAAEPDCWDIFARQRAGFAQCEDAAPNSQEPRVRRPEPETASVVIFGSRATPQ